MSKKSVYGLALVLGLVVAATSAFAFGPYYGGHMMGPGYYGHGRWATGQADSQFWSDSAKLRNELYEKQVKLDQLLNANPVDEAQVKSVHKDINRLTEELSQKQLAATLEYRKANPRTAERSDNDDGYGPGYCW